MSKASHTPGPWQVVTPARPMDGFTRAVTDRVGAALAWVLPHGAGGADEANARLIAAAPELLAALEATLALWREHGLGDGDDESEPVWNAALAAVAKAKKGGGA